MTNEELIVQAQLWGFRCETSSSGTMEIFPLEKENKDWHLALQGQYWVMFSQGHASLNFYPEDQPIYAFFGSIGGDTETISAVMKLKDMCSYASVLTSGVTLYLPPAFNLPITDVKLLNEFSSAEHLSSISVPRKSVE